MIIWPGTSTITFMSPLPCCTYHSDRQCRKSTTTATLYPTGGGMFIMQPVCPECAAALAKIYPENKQTNAKN